MLIDQLITPHVIRYLSEFTPLEIQASHRTAHPAPTQREDNTVRCAMCVPHIISLVEIETSSAAVASHDVLCAAALRQRQMI